MNAVVTLVLLTVPFVLMAAVIALLIVFIGNGTARSGR
jgi:hypothetical protein